MTAAGLGGEKGDESASSSKSTDKTEKSSLLEEEPDYGNNSKKKGESRKFDPSFKGPIEDRGCTDVICCIIFIICIIGMIAVGAIGFLYGDPEKLLYPTDSEGNVCGVGEFSDRPNLFFFDLIACADIGTAVVSTGCPTPQVCVKDCPAEYWTYPLQTALELVDSNEASSRSNKMICKLGVNPDTSAKVCVHHCPTQMWVYTEMDRYNSLNPHDLSARDQLICRNGRNPHVPPYSEKTVQQLVDDEDCASYYVESEPVLGRCVPAIINDLIDEANDIVTSDDNNTLVDRFGNAITGTQLEQGTEILAQLLNAYDYGVKIYQDVRASWWMILVALVMAMLISFIWIILMRWIAAPMVWITLVAFLAIFGFTTYYTFNRYFELEDDPNSQIDTVDIEFTTNLDYYQNLQITWLILGIASALFLLIVLIILIFLRQRIRIAIALIAASSKAVGHMIFTLFWPLIPFLLQIAVFAYWGGAALYLASMGDSEYGNVNATANNTAGDESQARETLAEITDTIPCDPGNDTSGSICTFVKYGGDEYTIYLQIYNLFMWFWLMNFIVALSHITLAGSFASYYWAFNKPGDIPHFPVSYSLYRALRYHLGSLAFGSLIIAIIQLIRVGLEYLDHKLKGSGNQAAQFLMKCLKCCFWCLEKFMKFLNKNAYIMIAVYGNNFCTSAKDAFFLIMRNIVRVVVIDKVTDFLLLIGKLMVVGAMATVSFFFFDGRIPYVDSYIERPELSFVLVPVILIAVGSYIIAAAFFGVYSMAVDTLFLCFLEDLERNDGTADKPYYMSKELMGILGKKNDPEVEAAR